MAYSSYTTYYSIIVKRSGPYDRRLSNMLFSNLLPLHRDLDIPLASPPLQRPIHRDLRSLDGGQGRGRS
jgi:hypothetical protein